MNINLDKYILVIERWFRFIGREFLGHRLDYFSTLNLGFGIDCLLLVVIQVRCIISAV